MQLIMLAKDKTSGDDGCPAGYLAENHTEFVFQGPEVDSATFSNLQNVLPGETGIRISIDVVRDVLARYDALQPG